MFRVSGFDFRASCSCLLPPAPCFLNCYPEGIEVIWHPERSELGRAQSMDLGFVLTIATVVPPAAPLPRPATMLPVYEGVNLQAVFHW